MGYVAVLFCLRFILVSDHDTPAIRLGCIYFDECTDTVISNIPISRTSKGIEVLSKEDKKKRSPDSETVQGSDLNVCVHGLKGEELSCLTVLYGQAMLRSTQLDCF